VKQKVARNKINISAPIRQDNILTAFIKTFKAKITHFKTMKSSTFKNNKLRANSNEYSLYRLAK